MVATVYGKGIMKTRKSSDGHAHFQAALPPAGRDQPHKAGQQGHFLEPNEVAKRTV